MRGLGVLLVFGMTACAPAPGAPGGMPVTPRTVDGASEARQGVGTLRQDQFTVSIRQDAVQVKVTPLEEDVIRLAAPDTYQRLNALAMSRRIEAQRASPSTPPRLLLVSFFSVEPDTPFEPEDLQIVQQGRVLRSILVLPLTPTWGTRRIQRQETQSALYAFETALDVNQPFSVRYRADESDEWGRAVLPRLEIERAKVSAGSGRVGILRRGYGIP